MIDIGRGTGPLAKFIGGLFLAIVGLMLLAYAVKYPALQRPGSIVSNGGALALISGVVIMLGSAEKLRLGIRWLWWLAVSTVLAAGLLVLLAVATGLATFAISGHAIFVVIPLCCTASVFSRVVAGAFSAILLELVFSITWWSIRFLGRYVA